MCVNDIVVQGAEPLFFLDYYATDKIDMPKSIDIINGIADGCQQAGCVLIGGETAEMPGLYNPGDYDLAGFGVGIVERDRLLTGHRISAGDLLIGLGSSGIHSNGFSLIRKIMSDQDLGYEDPAIFEANQSFAQAFLVPTKIYVKSCLAICLNLGVNGLAHITGGGLVENIPRILPNSLGISIDLLSWPIPPIFKWLSKTGGVHPLEMLKTFNCGIGMVAIINPAHKSEIMKILREHNETVFEIGFVTNTNQHENRVKTQNLSAAWKN